MAVFPGDGFLENLGVEAAPGLDGFQDQEVRAAGADLDVGGALDRAAVTVKSGTVYIFRETGRGDAAGL